MRNGNFKNRRQKLDNWRDKGIDKKEKSKNGWIDGLEQRYTTIKKKGIRFRQIKSASEF